MAVLNGRGAVIFGATGGFGQNLARTFVASGASVLLCGRNPAILMALVTSLENGLSDEQKVLSNVCDVLDIEKVETAIALAVKTLPRLDILVNCAGVFGPIGPIESVNWKEWTQSFNTNFLGTVYPIRSVLSHFKSQSYGKIINLSGGGSRALPRISSYGASKAAVNCFTETLAEEVKEFGIDVNSVAPGPLDTPFINSVLEAGPEKVGTALYEEVMAIRTSGGTDMALGAGLCVYLASGASDGVTGRLISARWDHWQTLHTHLEELKGSDIYTLRRILPADRGITLD